MTTEKRGNQYKCGKCGRVFTSAMRLMHHKAGEHAPMTSRDIRTTRYILHRPRRRTVQSCSTIRH